VLSVNHFEGDKAIKRAICPVWHWESEVFHRLVVYTEMLVGEEGVQPHVMVEHVIELGVKCIQFHFASLLFHSFAVEYVYLSEPVHTLLVVEVAGYNYKIKLLGVVNHAHKLFLVYLCDTY